MINFVFHYLNKKSNLRYTLILDIWRSHGRVLRYHGKISELCKQWYFKIHLIPYYRYYPLVFFLILFWIVNQFNVLDYPNMCKIVICVKSSYLRDWIITELYELSLNKLLKYFSIVNTLDNLDIILDFKIMLCIAR